MQRGTHSFLVRREGGECQATVLKGRTFSIGSLSVRPSVPPFTTPTLSEEGDVQKICVSHKGPFVQQRGVS